MKIPGFTRYEIDMNGNVWSWNKVGYLKPNNINGYLSVELWKDGKRKLKYVHR